MSKITRSSSSLIRIEKIIRETAWCSGKVYNTRHFERRMNERGISMTQVLKCLRSGEFVEGPTTCSEKQIGWKAQMRHCSAGQFVHVVLKLVEERGNYLLVITTFKR